MRVLILLILFASNAHGQIPSYELPLSQALIKGKNRSEDLKAVKSDEIASRERADATFTDLLPRLTLDGTLHYLSTVPSIQIVPNGPSFPFGAHLNYSIGPTLSYTLWDGGASRNLHKSLEKTTEARRQDVRTQTAQVLAAIKLAYVRTQLGLEQLQYIADSVRLAQLQSKDIGNRRREGTASELDYLTATKEVLSYELLFNQRQTDLAAALRDLIALVEEKSSFDLRQPAPKGFPKASLWLAFDPIEKTLQSENADEPAALGTSSPQILSQELAAESLVLLAKSQESSYYPQLQFSARSSLDYPNGPILQRINQNSLNVGLSMPLYEFSKIHHLIAEKNQEAESARHRRNQIETDMQRDFAKAKDALASLRKQDIDAQEVLRQAEKLAKMNYEAYRFGRITLVEVQAANLKTLQAKVDLSQIHAQILNQLITLQTLAVKDEQS